MLIYPHSDESKKVNPHSSIMSGKSSHFVKNSYFSSLPKLQVQHYLKSQVSSLSIWQHFSIKILVCTCAAINDPLIYKWKCPCVKPPASQWEKFNRLNDFDIALGDLYKLDLVTLISDCTQLGLLYTHPGLMTSNSATLNSPTSIKTYGRNSTD